MPYNSSAFEKQLAKYKAAEASKKVAEMVDPHQPRSRVPGMRGQVQATIVQPTQMMGEGGQSVPVLREDQQADAAGFAPIIVKAKTKPLYTRGWFLFLVTSLLSTASIPIFFKDEMAQVKGVVETVKTTTGVDPLSLKTYTSMAKGQPVAAPAMEAGAQPATPHGSAVGSPAGSSTGSAAPSVPMPANPMDMGQVIDHAQERARAVTSQGGDASMRYIEEETRRLQEMARELDRQRGH